MSDLVQALAHLRETWRTDAAKHREQRKPWWATGLTEAADDLDAVLRSAEASTATQFEALIADLRRLENIYNRNRVAQMDARQIEKIFDRWLHSAATPTGSGQP